MRQPSSRMTPNAARVRRVDFGHDRAAGRQGVPGVPGPLTRCAVQPATVRDVPEHLREQGVEYLTVKFYCDPNARVRDQVLDAAGRVLTVVGVRGSSGGAGRTWPVDCEYRPPAGQ